MRLLLWLSVALMAACATAPERAPLTDPAAAWKTRHASLGAIEHWNLRGRVALRNGEEGGQASLQWTREADRHRIEIAGPIGGARFRLTQGPYGAELQDMEDRIYRDASIQRLLSRRIGWDLPIDELNFWILGIPAPGQAARTELDAWGRLTSLEQAGWEVRFLEYAQRRELELPSRISARRLGSLAPVEVRLAIESFTANDPSKR